MDRRHDKVRLKMTSIKSFYDKTKLTVDISKPSWRQGFTRKARTPRQKKKANHDESIISQFNNPLHLVPEICPAGEYSNEEEDEEQLHYRVPVFDPFSAELCANPATSNDNNIHLHGFIPSDLFEFAADVEYLLGKGLEDESFDLEGLGIFDVDDTEWSGRVKVENGEQGEAAAYNRVDSELMIDRGRETFELNFDYDSPIKYEEEAQNGEQPIMMNAEKKMFLRLDCESVSSAWDGKGSPWTTEERPDLNFDERWPDCMSECGTMHVYGDMGRRATIADGGRAARVSRYREKRRTRLFSKKIRYEVRKLNAEKRPRMKGRFVKRANLVGAFPQ